MSDGAGDGQVMACCNWCLGSARFGSGGWLMGPLGERLKCVSGRTPCELTHHIRHLGVVGPPRGDLKI
jgi:hypothetical protein